MEMIDFNAKKGFLCDILQAQLLFFCQRMIQCT